MEKELFFAGLDWRSYHHLEADGGETAVFDNWHEAPHDGEVLAFYDEKDAKMAVEAFKRLCAAAWRPNQNSKEREDSLRIIAEAEKELQELREKSVPF